MREYSLQELIIEAEKLKNEPTQVVIQAATVVTNPMVFVESHVETLKSYPKSSRLYNLHFDRLVKFVNHFKIKKNQNDTRTI